jgi:hypothetical protein
MYIRTITEGKHHKMLCRVFSSYPILFRNVILSSLNFDLEEVLYAVWGLCRKGILEEDL